MNSTTSSTVIASEAQTVPDGAAQSESQQQNASALFRYTLTKRANEKNKYDIAEYDTEEFIDRFLELGVECGVKDGEGIIGATFAQHSRLEKKNVETVTALILDVDGKFKRDGEVVVEPVDPEWFIAQLPFRGVAHTSYSHSPAHPKFRVILPLAHPISAEEHHRLWHWVFEKVQKTCDASCKNPDRMFYLPRAPQEALEQKWPWVRALHGPLLTVEDVPADFVVPVPQELARETTRGPKRGLHLAPVTHPFSGGRKLLEAFMEQPLVKWAVNERASVGREVWRGIATNLAAIALEHDELYDDCLAAFHKISEDDARYRSSETTHTFEDAMVSAEKYGPMTFVHMLENGAPDSVAVEDCKTPIAAARHELHKQKRLAAKAEAPSAPLPSAGTPVEPSASMRTEEDAEGAHENDDCLDIFDLVPEDFLHDTENDRYLRRNSRGSWEEVPPMSPGSMDRMLLSLGLMQKNLVSWKAQIRSFNARKAIFARPTEVYVIADDVPFFNTYRRSKLAPVAGNWDDIKALLWNLVGEDSMGLEFFLDWLALPLQSLYTRGEPMKMGTSVVLQGRQGSGKGTVHNIMEQLYGEKNVALLGQDSLDSRFNDILIDKLFVTGNEVISSSNRSMEVANKLKMWITDPVIPVEGKFQGMTSTPNYFNIMFSSNDERPVIIEKDDRRFIVFQSKKFDRTISARIYKDLKGSSNQVAAFFDHLLFRKCKIGYGDLYETMARKEMIVASASSEDRFAADLVEQGWYGIGEAWRCAGHPNAPRVLVATDDGGVIAETLHDVYNDYCRRYGFMRGRSQRKLIRALRALIPELMKDQRRVGGSPTNLWFNLPMNPPGQVIEFPKKNEEAVATGEAGDFSA